ncbi:PEBP-like protein, partial [Lophiostoma macrostomum CBS 122681]
LLKFIEWSLGKLLFRSRGYDNQCFFKSRAFKLHPTPLIEIESPDCGKTGAVLSKEYSKVGLGRFPELSWPPASPDVKEFLLIAEDPDSPFGANVHGIYCFISPTVTTFGPSDLLLAEEGGPSKILKSGYRVGKNRRSVVYIPPRPPIGHGPHRYFFELIALREQLDPNKISSVPTKEELAEAVVGKVHSWGLWSATYESKW